MILVSISWQTESELKFFNVFNNLQNYSEVKVSYDGITDMLMGLSKTDSDDNDFQLAIGGWEGAKTIIRERNLGCVSN